MTRYCFDLDGVICQLNGGDYANAKPNMAVIAFINSVRKGGDYVIINTARRMRTHDGDVEKVIADVGKLTEDWLNRYNVTYDELHFGKPWANVYVDDNAVRYKDTRDLLTVLRCAEAENTALEALIKEGKLV